MKLISRRFDMKKVTAGFCFGLVMLCGTLTKAQTEEVEDGPISFGAKAGINLNSFDNTHPHNGHTVGFTIGIFGTYALSDLLGIQLEAAYFQQGGSLTRFKDDTRFGSPDDFFTHNVTTSRITLHNIEIPVLARVSIPSSGEVKPRIFLGPSIGVNLGATERYQRTGQLSNGLYVTASGREQIGGFQRLQFGLTGGVGIEVPFAGINLSIDARYRYGLSTAKKSFSYIEYSPVATDLRVNTLSLTVGARF